MGPDLLIGICTTLICALLAATWSRLLLPFLIEYFGERIKIYRWWLGNLNFSSGQLHGIKLEIKKRGYDIRGDLEFTTGRHAGKKYYIKGRFQSNILTFHYYPHDKHSTSQGTATFKRLLDGEQLSGHFAYFSQENNEVATVACNLSPVKHSGAA